MSEWVSVEDRLPVRGRAVLVWDGVNVDMAERRKKKNTWWLSWTDRDHEGMPFKKDGVTHWMPLPEPPK